MKTAAVLSFSERGGALAQRVAEVLRPEWDTECCAPKGDLKARTNELFHSRDALIFVGACGIAVRAIAPYVAAKTSDPAVLVIDECGRHVISLLSGHIGGANVLTHILAQALDADPVITTATDVNGRFSVDTWASTHGVHIGSMPLAKRFSAQILTRDLPVCSDFDLPERLPDGLVSGDSGELGAYIGLHGNTPFAGTLILTPRILCVGIGCKRGTPFEKIDAAVRGVLGTADLRAEGIARIASIDVKKDEEGLHAFARSLGIEPEFYTADELNAVPGDFGGSEFVKKTVGTDNVCERAAKLSAGGDGTVLVHKTRGDGVTVAVAVKKWRVSFE